MQYVRWAGREDCPFLSRLGFGSTRFLQSDLNTTEGFEKCVELVTYAIGKGINYFDVAPTYSNGLAEMQVYLYMLPQKPGYRLIELLMMYYIVLIQV